MSVDQSKVGRSLNTYERKVLEEFEGFVERMNGNIAYVKLTSKANGDVLEGEYDAAELRMAGLRERRRFRLVVVETTTVEVEDIPDVEVDEEKIGEEIDRLLGDG